MTDITTFDLETFLMGAKQTASRLDSEFTVTDNATGKVLGGTGLIMARLIDQVEWSQKRVAELEAAEPIHRNNLALCQSVADSLRERVTELEAALLWIVTCPESVMDGGNGARRVAESVITPK